MTPSTPTKQNTKEDYFPPKPDEKAFLTPVSWLGGRDFVRSLKSIVIYAIYGGSKDPRVWMKGNIYPLPEPCDEQVKDDASMFWAAQARGGWKWKEDNFEFWEDYFKANGRPGTNETGDDTNEFWFDYISDTGDGQKAVYSVACMCLSDLWRTANGDAKFFPDNKTEDELLPRGSFLFIGGDTGYYVADYTTLHDRFQMPFHWAFASIRKYLLENYGPKDEKILQKMAELKKASQEMPSKQRADDYRETWETWKGQFTVTGKYWDTEPVRPLFGVPANHDYYDDIDGFNRQFRRPPFEKLEENAVDKRYRSGIPLSIPTFQREQEASYIALRLPFGWWVLGIDSENEKLDFRQRVFYDELMKQFEPKKVILATPEPTTVFDNKCSEDDKTASYMRDITKPMGLEQPFWSDGELRAAKDEKGNAVNIKPGEYCRLDLSGDVHHYARYWGPPNPKSPDAGAPSSLNYASLVSGGGGAFMHPSETVNGRGENEVPSQLKFPEPAKSRYDVAERIFDLSNIRKGGYVQIVGAVIAVIIYFGLAYFSDTVNFFAEVKKSGLTSGFLTKIAWYLAQLIPIIILFICGWCMNRHVASLTDVRAKRFSDENKDLRGRITELRMIVFLFFAGVGAYVVWFKYFLPNRTPVGYLQYPESWLLIGNFVITGLIVGLSLEYGNWAALKYKYFGDEKEGPDDWFNLFGETFKIGFLESGNNFASRIWLNWKKYSVQHLPAILMNVIAIVFLVFGVYQFGYSDLGSVGMNLIFTIVVAGGFLGIVYFAVGSGGEHRDAKGKVGFFFIGLWHAAVQLLTPFVLVFYGDWRVLLGVLLLIILFNGSLLKWLTGGANLGTWAMRRFSPMMLAFLWFALGIVILATPFAARDWFEVYTIPALINEYLFEGWKLQLLTLLIVCYLGHLICRVWFSWYLAVSLAFNGHNNEAGGAARIEDFKQILRIKLERDKMTVYVIGVDDAKTDLKDLQPRVVDQFELRHKKFV